MLIGNKQFETKGHTYVMGILNVTPDSFSDGGTHNTLDAALSFAEKMIAEGADIIDVGGESTRPGYTKISNEEEIGRVAPVIERLKVEFEVPVSIDTYKAGVAKAAISSGADLVNDVWGLLYEDICGEDMPQENPGEKMAQMIPGEDMAQVIADAGVPCCLMHNRIKPVKAGKDLVAEIQKDMDRILKKAKQAGIREDRIILDPGVGFGKTYEHNLLMIQNMARYMPAGYPLLLGASRKSVIGLTLDLPVSERVEGTIATSVFAVMQNAMFVRVHDVKENVRAIKMAEAILNA